MRKFNKNSITTIWVVSFALVALSLNGPIAALAVATAPDLGVADSFSVLAEPSMTAANPTTISGDLGLSTGLEASKVGTWTHTGGSDYFGPLSLAKNAYDDALIAFNNLAGQTTSGVWSLSASPLPGVWTTAVSAVFPGPTLTLTGDYDDVWVFQIGSDFTFTGSVTLAGNAQACNVFWQVGNDATIAAGSNFVGTLIAGNDITVVSGATVNGRILSLNGALTTDDNTISGPTCVAAPVSINVVKNVINDNGLTKTTADFPLFVNGTPVVSGVTNSFPSVAAYTVTETGDSQYTQTFSGDCSAAGVIDLAVVGTKFCIVTNNDKASGVGSGGGGVNPPVPPLIDVVKVPDPLALPAGPGLVEYTYTLSNIGTVAVTDITMVGDTCSPIALVSGDVNADNKLNENETWIYRCSTTLSATHTNTIVATGWANGLSATDIASATVVVGVPVVPPLIHVTKVPSPLTLPVGGGMVTYTKKVTNPGTVALSNVSITDDKCSSVKYISGDTNSDSKLDTAETWTYTCQSNLTETTTNTVIATGEANGLTARDFAIATVVVAVAVPATVVPSLPNAGFYSDNIIFDIVILAGIIVLSLISLTIILRKRTS